MADDVISASAASLLDRAQEVLADALRDLSTIVESVRETPTEVVSSAQELRVNLVELRGNLLRAMDSIGALMPMSREPSASTFSTTETEQQVPLALNGLSATTQHRMAEIRSSLNLTDQQTFERCVATQSYIDDRLREGWKFTISRGRERRAVSFPGQLAV